MGQEKRYIQMQLDAQKDENQLNRDWQTAEAEKAREYQTSEREASQDFSSAERLASQQYQTEQWQRQFDIESNWNSESSKAARLRAVGVNPQIALGNAGTQMLTVGNVSAPSGPSPSSGHSPMPAPVSGLSPVSAQPDELRVASILNSIGDIAKNFQDVLKGGAETKWLNESFPKRIEQLVNDVDLQGLKKEEYKIANALMNVELTHSEEKQLAEIRKLQAEGNKLVSEGKNFDEIAKLNEKMQSFYQVLTQKEDYNSQLAALEVKYYIPKVNAYFENLNSQNASNYALAEKGREEAQSIRESRQPEALARDLQNLVLADSVIYNFKTLQDRVKKLGYDLQSQELRNKLVEVQVKDKDAYTTLQRLLYGKGDASGEDLKKAIRLLSEVSISGKD